MERWITRAVWTLATMCLILAAVVWYWLLYESP